MGHIDFSGAVLIVLLSADFFLPMRQLGSFFHVAMNGMAASDKIFRLLDLPDAPSGTKAPQNMEQVDIALRDVHFSYEPEREILRGVSLVLPRGSFIALVGESGCGKSTIASLLMGRNRHYTGEITLGGIPIADMREDALLRTVTYVGHDSMLFKGSVRDNLLMGAPDATDSELWGVAPGEAGRLPARRKGAGYAPERGRQ